MQQVEGSSPFIRFKKSPANRTVPLSGWKTTAGAWLHSLLIWGGFPPDLTVKPTAGNVGVGSQIGARSPANRMILVAEASGAIKRSSTRWSSFSTLHRFLQKVIARDQIFSGSDGTRSLE